MMPLCNVQFRIGVCSITLKRLQMLSLNLDINIKIHQTIDNEQNHNFTNTFVGIMSNCNFQDGNHVCSIPLKLLKIILHNMLYILSSITQYAEKMNHNFAYIFYEIMPI